AVFGNIGVIETSFRRQAVVKRRLRYCREHTDHSDRKARAICKSSVRGEDIFVVTVETDHQTAEYLHPSRLYATHLLNQGAAGSDVLKLLRLAKCFLTGAFDTYEDRTDIGARHQFHQLGVVSQVDRGFSSERQGIPLGFLPRDHVLQELFHRLLVTDEVVVHNEGERNFAFEEVVQLGDDLLWRFETW